jgi:hypothetical protein
MTVWHALHPPPRFPPGAHLVLNPFGPCDLWDLGPPLADSIVAKQAREGLLISHVRLEGLTLPRARPLTPRHPRTEVLARGVNDEPLLLAIDRPEGRVLVLSADLDRAELPLRVAFPVLMGNALLWMAGGGEGLREAVPGGATVLAELPVTSPGTGALRLWSPDGRASSPVAACGGKTALGPLDKAGVWRVAAAADGPAALEVAVNVADPAETDLRPVTPAKPTGQVSLSRGLSLPPAWVALLGLAAVGLVVEWWLYQRRLIA